MCVHISMYMCSFGAMHAPPAVSIIAYRYFVTPPFAISCTPLGPAAGLSAWIRALDEYRTLPLHARIPFLAAPGLAEASSKLVLRDTVARLLCGRCVNKQQTNRF